MRWGDDARYLDGEPMGKARARFADVLVLLVVVIGGTDIAYYSGLLR